MLVPDASIAVEYLLRTPRGEIAAATSEGDDGAAPALLDAEVLSVLRRLTQRGALLEQRALEALQDLGDWGISRQPLAALLAPAFALRANLSAYDALYVALAQLLGATLVTCDARLGRATGAVGVPVQVFDEMHGP